MDAELLAMCNQTVTRQAFVSYDDNNDFSWQTDVTSQAVVLVGTTGVVLHLGMMTGTLVVKNNTGATTYSATIDYEINYTTGVIKRRAGSTIADGATVYCTYSWQTITTFLARAQFKNVLIRGVDGHESLSTCQIYCDNVTINERDKISITTGTTVTYPEILSIEINVDEFGIIDHKVIYTK